LSSHLLAIPWVACLIKKKRGTSYWVSAAASRTPRTPWFPIIMSSTQIMFRVLPHLSLFSNTITKRNTRPCPKSQQVD
jgi:hypothetical protein